MHKGRKVTNTNLSYQLVNKARNTCAFNNSSELGKEDLAAAVILRITNGSRSLNEQLSMQNLAA